MTNKLLILLLLSVFLINFSYSKKFDRYDVAKALFDGGLSNITTFVCMANKLSGLDSSLLYTTKEGARGFGIFQFFHPYWCEINENGGGCNIECNKFLDDDLKDDIECVRKVLDTQGINAWKDTYNACRDEYSDVPDWVWARGQPEKSENMKFCPPTRDRSPRNV